MVTTTTPEDQTTTTEDPPLPENNEMLVVDPSTNRDPREEVPAGEPREGNMPSNETFTQYGDLPERLARTEVEWSSYGMPIQKDNQDHDPAHSVQGGLQAPPNEPAVTHPEKSELSDPVADLKHHGDDTVPAEEDTPVAGTGLTQADAERIIASEAE